MKSMIDSNIREEETIMQARIYGSILFNKKQKDFYLEGGDSTDDMSEAYVYDNKEHANKIRETLDEPDDFDIWNIEIVYRTVDD
jgi:hypothetical protein